MQRRIGMVIMLRSRMCVVVVMRMVDVSFMARVAVMLSVMRARHLQRRDRPAA